MFCIVSYALSLIGQIFSTTPLPITWLLSVNTNWEIWGKSSNFSMQRIFSGLRMAWMVSPAPTVAGNCWKTKCGCQIRLRWILNEYLDCHICQESIQICMELKHNVNATLVCNLQNQHENDLWSPEHSPSLIGDLCSVNVIFAENRAATVNGFCKPAATEILFAAQRGTLKRAMPTKSPVEMEDLF